MVLRYKFLREVGYDLRNGATKEWFFDDDGALTLDEVTVVDTCCGLGKPTLIPALQERNEMAHAREMVDMWLVRQSLLLSSFTVHMTVIP